MAGMSWGSERDKIQEIKDDRIGRRHSETQDPIYISSLNSIPDTRYESQSDTSELVRNTLPSSPKMQNTNTVHIITNNIDNEQRKVNKRSNTQRNVITLALILLYATYFAAVLIIHSKVQVGDYWCDGDGFLIISTGFVLVLIVYFKVMKPMFGKKVYKKVTRPIGLKLNNLIKLWYVQYASCGFFFGLITGYLIYDSSGDRTRLISIVGIVILLLFGFVFSAAPKKVKWRPVAWGIGLQFVIGCIILKWSIGKSVFHCFGSKVQTYLKFTDKGSGFVFGELSTEMGIFAFKILTVILFFSFCIQILYYYGAMQWIVRKMGWLLQITVGTTPCESISAAANIFVGQTEAPLMIKPYLSQMTKSELHTVMTGGFATIAGTVMAAFISFGVDPVHLLTASVMSAPAALAYSKLFYPEQETSVTEAKDIKIAKGKEANVLHAAMEGVANAIPLVATIAANLIAIIAFISFVDAILNWSCSMLDLKEGTCSLSNIFGYLLMPLAWVMGVPWEDCYIVGQLIGTKSMINEFVAYIQLANYKKQKTLTKRAEIIATYALCGFSNLSSIGAMLGGLGPMAPDRKGDMSKIVFRAMVAGNLACFLTACIAGTLISVEQEFVPSNGTAYDSSNST